jgi:Siphovirus Gp157
MAEAAHICTPTAGSAAEPQVQQFTSRPENAARALPSAAIHYKALRDRLKAEDPALDEQTLADTVEGLTDLHEILGAVIRAALADEALVSGLKGRIGEMEDRRERLQDRASKRRQIAKEVMTELNMRKLEAPDFTASIRPGMPGLVVLDEAEIPSIYWEPRDPKLNRTALSADLKQGAEVAGATLSNPEPILTVRTR